MAEAELRVEIRRSNRQPQSQIRFAEKIRLVAVIICITGKRGMPLHGHVVADLQQSTLNRIDLGKSSQRAQAAQKNPTPSPGTRHAGTSSPKASFGASGMIAHQATCSERSFR